MKRMGSTLLMLMIATGFMNTIHRTIPEWLEEIDLEKEHKLIQKKKSNLTRSKREIVERLYWHAKKEEKEKLEAREARANERAMNPKLIG